MKNKIVTKSKLAKSVILTLATLPLATSICAQAPPVNFPSLRVGDGTGSSTGDGTLVAEGKFWTSSLLSPTFQTAGARMLWYPRKSAFRAGSGTATTWSEATMGRYSFATGNANRASGDSSTAMGDSNTASGQGSTALGFYMNTASGTGATAMGYYTNTASGTGATAIGHANTASGFAATAIGYGNTASGYVATAMGVVSTASGWGATAMGYYTTASSYGETVIGSFNAETSGNPYPWSSNDPVFQIGNGHEEMYESDYEMDLDGDGEIDENWEVYIPLTYSNALTVYKNGNMELQGNLTLGGTITSAGSPVLTTTTGIAKGTTPNSGLLALGVNSSASGQNATAIGTTSRATGNSALALGQNTIARSISETVIGRFNKQDSMASSVIWYETDVLFRVGNGSSMLSLSDAITTLKNGQTTLTNKAWKANPTSPLADPPATTTDSGGEALVVDGHTVLNGKVTISVPQGDISMGNYN